MVFSEFRKLQAINFLFITCKAILAKYVSHKTPSKAPLLPYEIGPQSFLILPICEFLANRQRKMHAEDFDMHLSYMKGYLIARSIFLLTSSDPTGVSLSSLPPALRSPLRSH